MSVLVRHLVKNPKILLEIKKLNLAEYEENELMQMVTLLYHQKLLNRLLEFLEEEDKKIFLELLISTTEQNYLEFLHLRIANLEQIVEQAIIEIEEQISTDLSLSVKEG